jgi:hypothetical protein
MGHAGQPRCRPMRKTSLVGGRKGGTMEPEPATSGRYVMSTETSVSRDGRTPAIDSALRRIVAEIVDGLRHGYFDFRVTCDVVAQGRRRLVFHAGKSHQFLLTAEDCTAGRATGDPQHADASNTD